MTKTSIKICEYLLNISMNSAVGKKKLDDSDDGIMYDSDKDDGCVIVNSEEESSEFLKQCDQLLEKISKNYKDQRDEIRNLMKLHKKELKMYKKKKPSILKEQTGFTKPCPVPEKLAKFLKLDAGKELSRTELTKLLCGEFKKRGLYHKDDRRIIIPDAEVRKMFGLTKDAEKSTDPKDKNGLNFYNLQKYIAQCYKETGGKELVIGK